MQRVLKLISALAGTEMDGRVMVSPPEAIDGRENTRVRLKGTLDSGTYLDRVFRYNRINLSLIDPMALTHKGEADTHSLLEQLNVQAFLTTLIQTNGISYTLSNYIETTDIVNEPIQITPGKTLSVLLKIHPGNYVYTGALRISLTAP